MIHKILVPVDGSTHSIKALEFASDLASKYDAKLTIVNVIKNLPSQYTVVVGSSSMTVPSNIDLRKTASGVIDEAIATAKRLGATKVNAEIEIGSPAKMILAMAKRKDVDMIVMGSRGRGDLTGLLLGSVSHKVNQLAKCTCITVR